MLLGLLLPAAGLAQALPGGPAMLSESRTLSAGDGAAGAHFGHAVSVSGNLAAVGAYGADSGRGAVYIFAQNRGGPAHWQQVRKITAPDGQAGDHFGVAVSLSGDTLAVGAPENDEWGADAGMVYVFERNQGGADDWGFCCRVADSEVNAGDHFGYSVSLDLNLLAVGAHNDRVDGVATGAAYVFHRNYGSGWFRKVMRLAAPDGAAGDRFGIAVAVSHDRVIVGAHQDDNEGGADAGAAYVFWRDQGGYNQWGLLRKLRGETAEDGFGAAVAIHGSWVLVGAPYADGGGGPFGRAYLYERNQNGADGWGWVKTLNPAGVTGAPQFGGAVALDADRAVVGAPNDMEYGAAVGALHVYARDAGGLGNWGQIQRVVGQESAAGDAFGAAVALDPDTVVAGMQGDDPQGESSGTARLLTWSGNRWYFEQKLIRMDPEPTVKADYFGSSVSLKDGRLAAGSVGFAASWVICDDSTASLYERTRSGSAPPWRLQKEMQGIRHMTIDDDLGFDSCDDDDFGAALGWDGDYLAIGAPADGQNGRGIADLYERNQGGRDVWSRVGRSNQHTRHEREYVGDSLGIAGFTTVLGSRASSGEFGAERGGNAYLYCRDIGGLSGSWDYLRRIELWAYEGVVVALSGNLLAIGVPADNIVYLHARNRGGKDQWGLVATLRSPSSSYVGDFGGAVAVSGDTVAVGPLTFPDRTASVFIFQRNAGGADQWGVVREVLPGDSHLGSEFGCSLALEGGTLAVGAPGRADRAGAVYVYRRNEGGADHWGQVARVTAPDTGPGSLFGESVSLSGGFLAVGAPGDDEYDQDAGAVYTFVLRDNRAPEMGVINGPDFTRSTEDEPLDTMPTARAGSVVALAQTSDADGDACGMAVIGVEGAGGKWQFSGDGQHWNDFGGASPVNARLLGPAARIRFVPDANFSGAVRPGLTFRAWDQTAGFSTGIGDARQFGGATAFSERTETWGWEVTAVNDRPFVRPVGFPRMPDIWGNILDRYNQGESVSNLLQDLVTDVDGDECGLAAIGVSETSGRWQYSTDAGGRWRPLTALSAVNARLLGPTARIRFVPNQNYSGTVAGGLLFMAWDRTTGANGGLGNVQAGTAFSTGTQTFSITVTPVVNHAPVLDAFGDPVLPTIPRNATFNAGVTVADLLGDWVEDLDGDACGIALTQTDTAHGTWQYSRNDGLTWSAVGTVSVSSALLLGPDAVLRFVPALNYTGTVLPAIQYRAWDQTSGSEGAQADARNGGGNSAFSLVIEPAPITVSSDANHAPVLASPAQLYLPSIQEDETNSEGDTVGGLLGSAYSDADGNLCGVAVYAQDASHGTWQYRAPKEVAWLPMGAVSTAAARLLGPTMFVRFVPAAGYSGTITDGLRFRAWDRSAGDNGSTASVVTNGGSTPYSAGTGRIGVTVRPANDAPVLSGSGSLAFAAITENQFDNPGSSVLNLIKRVASDPDGDPCGIAIIGLDEQNGVWEFSLDGGTTWSRVGPLRGSYARLLAPAALVRLVPDVDYHGTITNAVRVRAWDQTAGTSGGLSMVLIPGGRSPYSAADRWASIQVEELNRPPTDLVLDNAAVPENEPAGTIVGQLSAADPNVADTHTFSLVAGAGAEDNGAFQILGNALQTGAVFDRETKSTYSVRLQARDAAGDAVEESFVITVSDRPDTAPSDVLLAPASVAEKQPAGIVVGQLTAVDPDLGETHTFSLVAGEGDADNGSFTVQGGALATAAVFDYETKRAYEVRVRADDGHGGMFARALTVAVLDADDNQAPWGISLNSSCLLDETPAGSAVGVFAARDFNPEDVHAFSLVSGEGDADNAFFSINAGTLLTTARIDFDAHPQYAIRVQADDGRGGVFQRPFVIVRAAALWQDDFESGLGGWTHAADVGTDTWALRQEAVLSPTHSLSATGTDSPSDASAISPWVGIPADAPQLRLQFHQRHDWGAFDPDLVDGGVLELRREGEPWWDILAGDTAASFVIGAYASEAGGAPDQPLWGRPVWGGSTEDVFVPVTVALDAAYLAGHNIQLRWRQAISSGVAGRRWHVEDVTLAVALPMNHPPAEVRLVPALIAENQPAGTQVGGLSAADPDASDAHAFSLVAGPGGDDNGSFRVQGAVLVTQAVFDYEAREQYAIRVRADDGRGGTIEQPLLVAVADRAVEDSDGDGFDDYDELVYLGSDPWDGNSHYGLTAWRLDGAQLTLTWSTVPGWSYVIDGCPDLAAGAWFEVAGPLLAEPGAGTTSVSIDMSALPGYPQDQFFVRVRALGRTSKER